MFLFTVKEQKISVTEAHCLWNLLSAKYHAIDNIQLWYSFAHDFDLKKIIKDFLIDLDEHITLLQNECKKYSIEAPARPKKHARGSVDTKLLEDELIGINYFTFLQGMVELVLFSIQYSTYNDSVRDFFVKFSKHAIEQTDNILRYIKIKGWLDIAPMLPNTSTKTGEQLGCIEAFHLWAHTSYRYTNYEQTLRWKEFVHDLDFKTILNQGVKLLDKQLVILERELEEFGISIPKRPPKIIKKIQDKSAFHDDYIFESLFIGLQWAGVLHAQAFKHCVSNDRIRILFKKFLYDEMDLVSHMIKYGKLKGWLETPPLYSG